MWRAMSPVPTKNHMARPGLLLLEPCASVHSVDSVVDNELLTETMEAMHM